MPSKTFPLASKVSASQDGGGQAGLILRIIIFQWRGLTDITILLTPVRFCLQNIFEQLSVYVLHVVDGNVVKVSFHVLLSQAFKKQFFQLCP